MDPYANAAFWLANLSSYCYRTMYCEVTSAVSDSVTPQTIVHQVPLSIWFSRQEYCSRLPCPPPGYLLDPGIEPTLSHVSCNGRQVLYHIVFQSLSHILLFWDPMDCSTQGFPVLHQFLELAQTHGLWLGDAIKPSHLLLSPSPLAFNLSQHQRLF